MTANEAQPSPFVSAPLPSPSAGMPAQHFSFPPPRSGAPPSLAAPMSSPAYWTGHAPPHAHNSQQHPHMQASGEGQQSMEVDEAEATSRAQQEQQGLPQAPMQSPQQERHPRHPLAGSPGSFPRDFNLVAEAANRAQLAVLMRDMGDVALS